ncbi:MAG TPA: tryptophan--tRNA ligase [Candidatus Paceibacterota bacterium]
MQKIILSGIRASGRLHLGNYLGAVRRFVQYQFEVDTKCLFFVADLHALTTPGDRKAMRQGTIEIVRDYLAAGIDPNKSSIYVQSSVPEIAELSLLLSMLQPVGDLQNTPSFKEKVKKYPQSVNLGLLSYPVLMAADILAPRATHVPVGPDQVAHLELAAGLAKRLNRLAGGESNVVPIPRTLANQQMVPGLRGGKMGKSDADDAVPITASRDEVARLYARAATDPGRTHRGSTGKPENCMAVYPIHQLLTDEPRLAEVTAVCRDGSRSCVECKAEAAERIADVLEPFQERRHELEQNDDFVLDVLSNGAKLARERASETLRFVRAAFGVTSFVK